MMPSDLTHPQARARIQWIKDQMLFTEQFPSKTEDPKSWMEWAHQRLDELQDGKYALKSIITGKVGHRESIKRANRMSKSLSRVTLEDMI